MAKSEIEMDERAFWTRVKREGRLIFFFSFVANILFLVLPFYILTVYNNVIAGDSRDTLLFLTLIAVFLFVIYFIVDACRGALLSGIGWDVFERLSARAASAEITLKRRGEDARVLDDLLALKGFFDTRYVAPIFDAAFAPVYLLALFFLHVDFGLIACAAGVIILGVAWREYRSANHGQNSMAEPGRHIALIQNLVRTDRGAMQTYPLRRHIAGSVRSSLGVKLEPLKRRHAASAINMSLIRFVRIIAQLLTLGLGALLVLNDAISAGVIIATSVLLLRTLGPVETMTSLAGTLIAARAASRRLAEAFASAEESGPAPDRPAKDAALSICGLILPASGDGADREIALTARAGSMIAVEGSSGAGKSAFFDRLAGAQLEAGVFRLGETDLGVMSGDARGALVHMVGPQGLLLPGGLRDNLKVGAGSSDETLRSLLRHRPLAAAASKLESQIRAGRAPCLSPGEAQIIALARACLISPRILLLDRADGPLDAEGAAFLRAIIGALRRSGGIVFCHSAHRQLAEEADYRLTITADAECRLEAPKPRLAAGGGAARPSAVPSTVHDELDRLAVAFG